MFLSLDRSNLSATLPKEEQITQFQFKHNIFASWTLDQHFSYGILVENYQNLRANFGWRICSDFFFNVSLSLIDFYHLLSNRWHQLAAHSQSSQSSPCWVAETLALRRSVFLASSAVFQRRDPDEFYSDQPMPEGVMWTLRDSLLIHKWTWPHGRRWGFDPFVFWV